MSPALRHATSGAVVQRFVDAWRQQNYARMYAMLDSSSRRAVNSSEFVAECQGAMQLATLRRFGRGPHPLNRVATGGGCRQRP